MIDIETYCGICGAHCCNQTNIEYGQRSVKITIGCATCATNTKELEAEIEKLKDYIYELEHEE